MPCTSGRRSTIEANHVHVGIDSCSRCITALGDRGISKKILVCARFHPSLPKVRLKEQASQDARIRYTRDRPTAGTSRVTRQGWVHGAEGAVSPHPSPAWKAAVWAYPPYAADYDSSFVDSKRHGYRGSRTCWTDIRAGIIKFSYGVRVTPD